MLLRGEQVEPAVTVAKTFTPAGIMDIVAIFKRVASEVGRDIILVDFHDVDTADKPIIMLRYRRKFFAAVVDP